MIKLNGNWTSIDTDKAIRLLSEGKKVLATLEDENGIYAAKVYSYEYGNVVMDKEYKEFAQKGIWYVEESK